MSTTTFLNYSIKALKEKMAKMLLFSPGDGVVISLLPTSLPFPTLPTMSKYCSWVLTRPGLSCCELRNLMSCPFHSALSPEFVGVELIIRHFLHVFSPPLQMTPGARSTCLALFYELRVWSSGNDLPAHASHS
jgi:hypothetical protein